MSDDLFGQAATPAAVRHHAGPVRRFEWLGFTIRAVEHDDEMYLNAGDACTALTLSNTSMAVGRIPDEYRIKLSVAEDNRRGRPDSWWLNEPGCVMLAMRSDRPVAIKFRRHVAEIFTKWRRGELATRQPEALAMPDWSNLSNDQLRFINQLGQAVTAASQAAIENAAKVRELEPSATAWNVLASAHGDYSLRDSAFILNRDAKISTGQNRLKRTLHELGMIDSRDIPYARHAEHIRERPQTFRHPRTGEEVAARPQLRISAAGLRYLHRRLGGAEPLALDDPQRLDSDGEGA